MKQLQDWFAGLDDSAYAIVIGLIYIAIFVSLVMLIASIQIPEYRHVDPAFTAGKIVDGGRVAEAPGSLYTQDLIKCTSFKLALDYGEPVTMTVHYYDADGAWIHSEKVPADAGIVKKYGEMVFQLNEASAPVEAAGIRLSVTKSGGSGVFSDFERLTFSWKFKLEISTSLSPEYIDYKYSGNLRFYRIDDKGNGSSDWLVGQYISFTSLVECTSFKLELDEPSKYTLVVHYYKQDPNGKKDEQRWLGCEYLVDGKLYKSYEQMKDLGANAINICVYRKDLKVFDFPDDLGLPMSPGSFRSHFKLQISTKGS